MLEVGRKSSFISTAKALGALVRTLSELGADRVYVSALDDVLTVTIFDREFFDELSVGKDLETTRKEHDGRLHEKTSFYVNKSTKIEHFNSIEKE